MQLIDRSLFGALSLSLAVAGFGCATAPAETMMETPRFATSLSLEADFAPSAVPDVMGQGTLELVVVAAGDTLNPMKVNGSASRRVIETQEDITTTASMPRLAIDDVWTVALRIGNPHQDPDDCTALRNVTLTMSDDSGTPVAVWEHSRPIVLQYSGAGGEDCPNGAPSVALNPGVVR